MVSCWTLFFFFIHLHRRFVLWCCADERSNLAFAIFHLSERKVNRFHLPITSRSSLAPFECDTSNSRWWASSSLTLLSLYCSLGYYTAIALVAVLWPWQCSQQRRRPCSPVLTVDLVAPQVTFVKLTRRRRCRYMCTCVGDYVRWSNSHQQQLTFSDSALKFQQDAGWLIYIFESVALKQCWPRVRVTRIK